jgi:hypothetical protein
VVSFQKGSRSIQIDGPTNRSPPFAVSTIATCAALCVGSLVGMARLRLGILERYGEVLSGAFIALVGIVFGLWPVL